MIAYYTFAKLLSFSLSLSLSLSLSKNSERLGISLTTKLEVELNHKHTWSQVLPILHTNTNKGSPTQMHFFLINITQTWATHTGTRERVCQAWVFFLVHTHKVLGSVYFLLCHWAACGLAYISDPSIRHIFSFFKFVFNACVCCVLTCLCVLHSYIASQILPSGLHSFWITI